MTTMKVKDTYINLNRVNTYKVVETPNGVLINFEFNNQVESVAVPGMSIGEAHAAIKVGLSRCVGVSFDIETIVEDIKRGKIKV